jgi:hypothetical protein
MNEIDTYIGGFPVDVRERLKAIRDTVRELAP